MTRKKSAILVPPQRVQPDLCHETDTRLRKVVAVSRTKRIKQIGMACGIALAIGAATILWRNLDGALLLSALQHLQVLPPALIASAIGLVTLSFVLAGCYEAVALREIGQPLGVLKPIMVTLIANPIGHTLGVSVLSAGALRYRIYAASGLGAAQIGKVIVLTAMPFLLGVALLLSVALLSGSERAAIALHVHPAVVAVAGAAGIVINLGYVAFTASRKLQLKPPRLPSTLTQYGYGVVEILLIAAVLYLFMPSDLGMGIASFLVVYLIAVLLGQVSSVPAGLGVLEASLMVMLPHVPKEELLAAVLAYRVIFEVLPLLVALLLLATYEAGSRRGVIGRWWRARQIED